MDITFTLNDNQVAAITDALPNTVPPLTVQDYINNLVLSSIANAVENYNRKQADLLFQQFQSLDPTTQASITSTINNATKISPSPAKLA